MTRVVAVAFALAALMAGASAPAPGGAAAIAATGSPELAILRQSPPRPNLLARVDPITLRPVDARRVPLRSAGGWAFAPNRDRIAFAISQSNVTSNFPRSWIRLVDPVAMRRIGDVPLGPGWVSAHAWLAPDRIVALQQTLATESSLVVVDPVDRRVVARLRLDGWAFEARRTAHELVVLLAPAADRIGPTRLARIGANGEIDLVTLLQIPGGAEPTEHGDSHALRQRHPGFALDAAARTAYVLADSGVVAEVELETMTARYHTPTQVTTWLSRLRNWLEPAAQAKTAEGTIRYARWLGNGLLATAGTNHSIVRGSSGEQRTVTEPAGVHVIDVRSWRRRTIDASGAYVTWAGGFLFVSGYRPDWLEQSRAAGVVAYQPDGNVVLRLFEGRVANVGEVCAGRAYVWIGNRIAIVDLASGRVLATRRNVPRFVRETTWLDL
jgi:hypothetical protein